jgi:hypothetical protein
VFDPAWGRVKEREMTLKISITDCKIYGGGSIVSSPSDASYEFNGSGNEIHGVKNLFHLRETTELEFLHRLGLKEGVDFELINRVLSHLHAMWKAPQAVKVILVQTSGLANWLSDGNSVASLTTNLLGVVQQMVQEGRAPKL